MYAINVVKLENSLWQTKYIIRFIFKKKEIIIYRCIKKIEIL